MLVFESRNVRSMSFWATVAHVAIRTSDVIEARLLANIAKGSAIQIFFPRPASTSPNHLHVPLASQMFMELDLRLANGFAHFAMNVSIHVLGEQRSC